MITTEETRQLDVMIRRIVMDPCIDWHMKRRLLEGVSPSAGLPLIAQVSSPHCAPGAQLRISTECYMDPDCTILHANPIIADQTGTFPPIYFKAPVT